MDPAGLKGRPSLFARANLNLPQSAAFTSRAAAKLESSAARAMPTLIARRESSRKKCRRVRHADPSPTLIHYQNVPRTSNHQRLRAVVLVGLRSSGFRRRLDDGALGLTHQRAKIQRCHGQKRQNATCKQRNDYLRPSTPKAKKSVTAAVAAERHKLHRLQHSIE